MFLAMRVEGVEMFVFGAEVERFLVGREGYSKIDAVVGPKAIVEFAAGSDRIEVVVERAGIEHPIGCDSQIAVKREIALAKYPEPLALKAEGIDAFADSDSKKTVLLTDYRTGENSWFSESIISIFEGRRLELPAEFSLRRESEHAAVFSAQVETAARIETGQADAGFEFFRPEESKAVPL